MESSARTSYALQSIVKARVYASSDNLYRRYQWQLFITALVVNDLLMTALAFRSAFYVRFQLSLAFFQLNVEPSLYYYRMLTLIMLPVLLSIYIAMGLYNRHNLLGGTQEYASLFNATTIGLFTVIAIGFLIPDFVLARGWLLLAWFFTFLFTAVGRFTLRRVVYAARLHGYFLTPALIVGANEEGRSLAEQLLQWKTSGLMVMGFIDDRVEPDAEIYQNLHSLGTVEQLPEIIERYQVRELILTTSAMTREEMVAIFKKYGVCNKVTLRLSSGLFEIITTGLQVSELASVPLVRVNKARLAGIDRVLKLLLDYAITIPGLLVISPVMLLVALAVRLDSPGPVIYRRRVMGVNGEQFDAFKFRTMRMDGDDILAQYPELAAELAENYKLVEDPRITRVGQFLRRYSLDELPQLFNVVRREMSLVGPRMISPAEMSKYDKWDMNLLTVPPGITGLWQVSGRSDVSYDERVRLDMHYIRNWSIWLDIQLLIETVPAVLKARGAY